MSTTKRRTHMTRRSAKRMQSMAKMTTIRVSSNSIFDRKVLLRLASIINAFDVSSIFVKDSFEHFNTLHFSWTIFPLFHNQLYA